MKGRLKGAQTGHSLLKKKADALQMRFRLILGKIIEVRNKEGFEAKLVVGGALMKLVLCRRQKR
jgi:vacuolar-type H+-ATPase subunit D/Vma8